MALAMGCAPTLATPPTATQASTATAPLATALDATKDQKERGSILDSIDMCDEIIAAVTKLPAEVKKAKH